MNRSCRNLIGPADRPAIPPRKHGTRDVAERHPCAGRSSAAAPRRGAVVLVAMVGVLVGGMISMALVRLAIARHRQVQSEAIRAQAAWLAEAGVERAAASLSADADYQGETWTISEEEFGRGRSAQVTITVSAAAEQDDPDPRVRVIAVADYPADGHSTARVRKTVLVRR